MSTKADISHAHALQLFNANQLGQALSVYKQLFTQNEKDAQAWHMAGAIAGISGDYTSAKFYSKQAVRLSPQAHGPSLNLAKILQASGDLEDAKQQYIQALDLSPGDPQTQTDLASLLIQLGEFDQAEYYLQRVIQSHPEYDSAHNALGNNYRETSRPDAAISCYQQAISIRADYVDALCNLGAVLCEQLRFKDAGYCYSSALQYQPDNPSALHGQGNLYQSTGDYEKAKICYQKALSLNPADTGITSSLASLYERCGEQGAASELIAPLIHSRQFNPDIAVVYAKLCSKAGDYESAIQILNEGLEKFKSPGKIIDIHFSLGDLYDLSGKYEEAIYCYKNANDMDSKSLPAADYSASTEKIIDFYSSQHWPALPRSTNNSELPVFIVGMPRSGTSLVEQILASHPQVNPGGERNDIFTIIDSQMPNPESGESFLNPLKSMTTESLVKLADNYVESIKGLSSECSRFTDKTPLHGMLLGFINQLLPRSRVIICNRNPMDTCLSIYFHRFNAFHGYATRMDSLGSFYRQYHILLNHWTSILDIKILQVQYEELVMNPEYNIRKLVDFCGLDWDNNCLSFYKNTRTVHTPSYNQVRRPIYTSSIDRWKNYDQYLEQLKTALTGAHN